MRQKLGETGFTTKIDISCDTHETPDNAHQFVLYYHVILRFWLILRRVHSEELVLKLYWLELRHTDIRATSDTSDVLFAGLGLPKMRQCQSYAQFWSRTYSKSVFLMQYWLNWGAVLSLTTCQWSFYLNFSHLHNIILAL